MPSRFHIIALTLALTIIGLWLFWYKYSVLRYPLTPDSEYRSWYVETTLTASPKANEPVTIQMWLPSKSNNQLVSLDETFVSSGYGIQKKFDSKTGNRWVILTKRNLKESESILYRTTLVELDSRVDRQQQSAISSLYNQDNRYQLNLPDNAPLFIAIDSIIEEARSRSADESSFATEIYQLAALQDERTRIISYEAEELKQNKNLPRADALAVLLLNTAGIPARLANGVLLAEGQRRVSINHWTEVWIDGRWQVFTDNILQSKPKNYLTWWYGYQPLVRYSGARNLDTLISVKRNLDKALTSELAEQRQNALPIPTLYQLPVGTQLIFEVLLLIPIGGLVIAFLRQIIGLITFGTFMPVLIALAFRETGLFAGIVSFSIVVFLGLLVRSYFHKLQLLLVPRLAAVLTVTVLILIAFSLLVHAWGWSVGLSVSLFPIVIMAMVIERMALQWDEYGAKKAIHTGLGSLLAAVISYFIMNLKIVGHLLFTFPELLLVILALTIIMGRYSGYKLTEYWRFKQL